jgi:hypothetical protein
MTKAHRCFGVLIVRFVDLPLYIVQGRLEERAAVAGAEAGVCAAQEGSLHHAGCVSEPDLSARRSRDVVARSVERRTRLVLLGRRATWFFGFRYQRCVDGRGAPYGEEWQVATDDGSSKTISPVWMFTAWLATAIRVASFGVSAGAGMAGSASGVECELLPHGVSVKGVQRQGRAFNE